MKRFLFLIFALFLLSGCANQQETYKHPVKFFYTVKFSRDNPESGLPLSETREGYGYENSLDALLRLYFRGPQASHMRSPFPSDTVLLSIAQERSTVKIILSDSYASMSGYQLTVANVCLAQTIFGITDAEKVQISVRNEQIDNQDKITIRKDQLIFIDNSELTNEQR